MAEAGNFDIPGVSMPTWIVRFDKDGKCTTPDAADGTIAAIDAGDYSHIIFMSHGWNTDFGNAIGQYSEFLTNFETVAGAHAGTDFKPFFVGVNWPSIWFPMDDGPAVAAGGDPRTPVVEAVTAEGPGRVRLSQLLGQASLTRQEVEEAMAIALPALEVEPQEDVEPIIALTPEVLAIAAGQMQAVSEPIDYNARPGTFDEESSAEEARVAGILEMLNPLHVLRLFSLYTMKDRAGRVGARGGAALLRRLTATGLPVHLVGHSFGAKVMLSAVVAGTTAVPPPRSALLLQPAISHLSFASLVKGRTGPGGYISALLPERIAGPVFTTFSQGDHPLRDVFHLALRRPADLGDFRVAAMPDDPPSVYAAMGGYGPRKSGEVILDPIKAPAGSYSVSPGTRLVALDGSAAVDYPVPGPGRRIPSHGGVASPYTAWALLQQIFPS